MREQRWKRLRTGLLIIAFSAIGMLEYVQLVQAFDLPQMMLVVPVVSVIAMLLLGKYSFFVPVCTIVLASAYQILAGSENAVAELQTSARSIAIILFECLLVLMIAQFIGLGLGAAARTLGKKNKKRVVKIVIGVVFAVVSLVPYLLLFHNPLYPMTARHRLKSFADKTITDYPIADKKVYYSLNDSRYMCRVIMSDGQVRVLYLDENGEAKRQWFTGLRNSLKQKSKASESVRTKVSSGQ